MVKSRRSKAASLAKDEPKPATRNSTDGDIESAIARLSSQSTGKPSVSGDHVQKANPPWTETDASSTIGLFVVGSPTWSETGDDVDDDSSCWTGDSTSNGSEIELRAITPVLPAVVVSPKEIKAIRVTLKDRPSSTVCRLGRQDKGEGSDRYHPTGHDLYKSYWGDDNTQSLRRTKNNSSDIERGQENPSSPTKSGNISRLFVGQLSRPETPISHTFKPQKLQTLDGLYTGDGEYVRTGRADRRIGQPTVTKPAVPLPLSAVVVSPEDSVAGGSI